MNSLFKNNIFSVSLGTLLSKIAGFMRQIFIAAAFGVGITYDAYNYAYIIPGFLIIIIGGINGPLHNAIVTVLTPLTSKRAALILKNVSIKITLLLLLIGIIIFCNAELIITNIGPNLSSETKLIAIQQLKILSPCIPLSGFNGLSFGALNSKDKFFISSISPSIVSLVTIFFILFYWIFILRNQLSDNLIYSELLAIATLTGTLIQFIIQVYETYKVGLLKLNFKICKTLEEEIRIFKIIIPASLSSGLGQINVFVDMFFVSSFKGAASGLAYGNFLIQAPLGILSNSLILPLLPKFSKLINKKDIKKFEKFLISGIEYCFLCTFLLTGLFISFNEQIVDLVFQRGAFNYEAAFLVKKILIAYSIGLPAYLYRDLLIRTYYSIEKTKLPFKLSLIGIFLNIIFDWFLIGAPTNAMGNLFPYNFGVVGIVLSSGFVNLIICVILTIRLKKYLVNFPRLLLLRKIIFIASSCYLSIYLSNLTLNISVSNSNNIVKLLLLIIGSIVFSAVYFLFTKILKVNNLSLNFKNF